ncbi:MAG: thiamine-phosphate kinase [Alphaproteobacteria bacterium]|nr:thiamine-phosphate kinase [Alphaproteobacteria bacterium]
MADTPLEPALSGEDDLIARYFRPLAHDPGAFALIDDAAILRHEGEDIVVTTDAVVEGVHYLESDPPASIACKALRVNISDLAAKGARPAGFVLTLALTSASDAWLRPFADALGADADRFCCPLLGGDTVATPGPQMVSITAFGRVPENTMLRRSTARLGDCVLVSGTIGDATLGLALLKSGAKAADVAEAEAAFLIDRYRLPQPRMALASALRRYASAAMDVSDGLAGDAARLCRASGVAASIDACRVPLSAAAAARVASGNVALATLLSGGDDYEILCTVGEAGRDALIAAAQDAGIALTEIGRVIDARAGGACRFDDGTGREMVFTRAAFSHF